MLAYPISILGYFILGVAGACTFVFLLLMFDKDIAILQNDKVALPIMILIYALLGGVVSTVVNIAGNPDFGASQLALAFSAGMGWPALATGISAAKRVGDVNETAKKRVKEAENNVDFAKAVKERDLRSRDDFYREELERKDKALKDVTELLQKELDRANEYFSKRIASLEGGE